MVNCLNLTTVPPRVLDAFRNVGPGYFLAGFFSQNKITGLAIKMVE
jgi:hypothetical protein